MSKSKVTIILLILLLLVTLVYNQSMKFIKNEEINKYHIELEKAKDELETLSNDLYGKEDEISMLKTADTELDDKIHELQSDLAILRIEYEGKRIEETVYKLLASEWTTYMSPSKIIGEWEAIDLILEEKKFNPESTNNDDLLIHSIIFHENSVKINSKDKQIANNKWTDDVIYDEEIVKEFKIKTFDGLDYLILEWKNNDYLSRGKNYGYYVFKRVE